MKENLAIILFGPNGCGKDTQAKLLEDLGFVHISTGQICRESRDPQILETIAKGKRIDDSKMLNLLIEHESFNASRVIINGFPRTRLQVGMLHKALKSREILFLHLKTTREIAEIRISNRFNDSQKSGKVRPDDGFSIARERLDDYFRDESLICRKARELWHFATVPNDGKINDVFGLIKNALTHHFNLDLNHHHDMSIFETGFALTHLARVRDPISIFH